jgi:hypothetical protein
LAAAGGRSCREGAPIVEGVARGGGLARGGRGFQRKGSGVGRTRTLDTITPWARRSGGSRGEERAAARGGGRGDGRAAQPAARGRDVLEEGRGSRGCPDC